MNYQQIDLFTDTLPKLKLEGKEIYLIECFAGIGSQYSALKVLERYSNNKFKVISHKIVEWAYNSYVMYNQLHIKDYKDYSQGKSKEEMLKRIKGTSTNYNEPLTDKQLSKKPIEWIKSAYNSCIATNNLINIMNVKGSDLEIKKDKNKLYCLTYSFPCQDISLAGLGKGLEKSQADGGTRSGLLWEIERILDELDNREREHSSLPDILLMENVPPLLSASNGNLKQFQKWEQKLASMGYSNFVKILNSKDYGIPQNRERVFMISILGNYTYDFPAPLPLKYKIKNMLEHNVDEKYYLSESMINYITAENDKWTGNNGGGIINRKIGCALNTKPSGRRCDASNYIGEDFEENTNLTMYIKNNTEKGYLEASEGDGIDISTRMHHHRGNVQKGKTQTLTTTGGQKEG